MLIIPAIDLIGGRCVRLHQGDYGRQTSYGDDPVEQARLFAQAGFERLHVVDLDGARQGKGANRSALQSIRRRVALPIQSGGGIRKVEDVRQLRACGIDYLILGTVLLEDPQQVEAWIREQGNRTFIAGLDLRDGLLQVRGWRSSSPISLQEACRRLQGWGIRQVICTDVASDGTLGEPRYSLYGKLRELLAGEIRIIAAGGVSRPVQIPRLEQCGVWGAVVGRALYEGPYSLEEWADAG